MCALRTGRSASAFTQSDQNFTGAFRIVKIAKFLHAHNEVSEQTAGMPRKGLAR